jgi:hypothetical protein
MFGKKRILYSDIPRPYDQQAQRYAAVVLVIMGACFTLALCAILAGGL